MFSGIVAGTGTVRSFVRSGKSAKLTVNGKGVLGKLFSGESISVNGVCLTVVRKSGSTFSADLSDETLQRTTLRLLRTGARVNLEQAARFSDRIGGHLVSGHVDGVGRIRSIQPVDRSFRFRIELPKKLLAFCIEKGSISVDGISLTINKVTGKEISIMIIPHTMTVTNLETKKAGDDVNIEVDMIARYLKKFVKLK